MATKRWRGDATNVAQVTGWTFGGTFEADDLVIISLNGKSLTVTAGSTTLTTVVDNIVTAYNNSTIPEFAEMTASRSGNDLRLAADTAGRPFTNPTITTTEAGGGAADAQTIGSATAVTASSGESHWDTAANWSPSGVPATGDDVYIERGEDILYGLDQNAVTLTSLNVFNDIPIGLPEEEGDYFEHRETYLKISATTINIDSTAGRLKLNTGTNATTINVYNLGQPADAETDYALLWKGAHANNTLNVLRGTVGVAAFAGETATLPTLKIGYISNVSGDAVVKTGSGVTLTTIDKSGGELEVNSNFTDLTQTDGITTVAAGAATNKPTIRGGDLRWNSTGTLPGAVVSGKGTLDFTRDMRTKTVSAAIEKYGDEARILDRFKVVTSLIIDYNEATKLDRDEIGTNFKLTRAAVT